MVWTAVLYGLVATYLVSYCLEIRPYVLRGISFWRTIATGPLSLILSMVIRFLALSGILAILIHRTTMPYPSLAATSVMLGMTIAWAPRKVAGLIRRTAARKKEHVSALAEIVISLERWLWVDTIGCFSRAESQLVTAIVSEYSDRPWVVLTAFEVHRTSIIQQYYKHKKDYGDLWIHLGLEIVGDHNHKRIAALLFTMGLDRLRLELREIAEGKTNHRIVRADRRKPLKEWSAEELVFSKRANERTVGELLVGPKRERIE